MRSFRAQKNRLLENSGGQLSFAMALIILALLATPVALHQFWGVSLSPVLDQSMAPTLHQGDLIVTVPKMASSLRPGEIVVLPNSTNRHLSAHRIDSLQIKGSEVVIAIEAIGTKSQTDAKKENNVETEKDTFTLLASSTKLGVKVASVSGIGGILDISIPRINRVPSQR